MPVSCVAPLRRECVHHSLREPHPSVTFLIGLHWWIGWWRQVIVGGRAGSYPLSLQDLVRDGFLEIISDHEYIYIYIYPKIHALYTNQLSWPVVLTELDAIHILAQFHPRVQKRSRCSRLEEFEGRSLGSSSWSKQAKRSATWCDMFVVMVHEWPNAIMWHVVGIQVIWLVYFKNDHD